LWTESERGLSYQCRMRSGHALVLRVCRHCSRRLKSSISMILDGRDWFVMSIKDHLPTSYSFVHEFLMRTRIGIILWYLSLYLHNKKRRVNLHILWGTRGSWSRNQMGDIVSYLTKRIIWRYIIKSIST
jgi:hypothetical protein